MREELLPHDTVEEPEAVVLPAAIEARIAFEASVWLEVGDALIAFLRVFALVAFVALVVLVAFVALVTLVALL